MDKQQKLDYQLKIEQFLSGEHIYDLMEDLLKALIVKQPDDPLSFLIDKLSHPPTKKIFLVGPPGFKVREFALQVADHYKLTTISVGDLLRKEKSKKLELGQEIESCFKQFNNVGDQIVNNLVRKEIELIQKDKKSFILSGFPKTRAQGLAMQREGIFPDAFILLNMPEQNLLHFCEQKFKANEKTLDKGVVGNRAAHIAAHAKEYQLNIKHIKEIYPNKYFQIDCHKGANREEILEDIARLLKFKIKSKKPKRAACILVLGGPKAVRVSVCRRLTHRYGFVLAILRELLNQQIAKNSEVGRMVLEHIRTKTLVKDSIVNGLVQNRLSQVDAQMQGFVLEGYPKTVGQAVALKETYIQPSLIVLLEGEGLSAEVARQLNERHQSVILKLSGQLGEDKIFEKICFHLENNS